MARACKSITESVGNTPIVDADVNVDMNSVVKKPLVGAVFSLIQWMLGRKTEEFANNSWLDVGTGPWGADNASSGPVFLA